MFDFFLLLIAGLSQLALGLLGLRVSVRPPKKAHRVRYELAFLIIGLIGLGAIVWSGQRSVSVQGAIADGVERIQVRLGIRDGGQTEETSLFLQCEASTMPKTVPASGEFWVYTTDASDALKAFPTFGGASLGRYFGYQPGSEMKWGFGSLFVQKCDLFNYGHTPIFKVNLTFDVALREAIRNDSGTGFTAGKFLEAGKWLMTVGKIDEGQSNPFEFYFQNWRWPYFIQIGRTPSATFITSADGPEQSAKVISDSPNVPMFLDPSNAVENANNHQ